MNWELLPRDQTDLSSCFLCNAWGKPALGFSSTSHRLFELHFHDFASSPKTTGTWQRDTEGIPCIFHVQNDSSINLLLQTMKCVQMLCKNNTHSWNSTTAVCNTELQRYTFQTEDCHILGTRNNSAWEIRAGRTEHDSLTGHDIHDSAAVPRQSFSGYVTSKKNNFMKSTQDSWEGKKNRTQKPWHTKPAEM